MRRAMMPILLLLVSTFVLAKVGLSLLPGQEEIHSAAVESQTTDSIDNLALESRDTVLGETIVAIGDQLIPSVEAAASMAIAEESVSSPSERKLLESLRTTREKLAELEEKLAEREKEAQAAELKAAERIAELEKLEARIQTLLQQEDSIKSKKIKRLTAVYEGMKAEKAAPVIAQMELATVVKMFMRMNEKQVGKILSFLPPEKAVIISHALTRKIGKI